jgi:hypothetical protein
MNRIIRSRLSCLAVLLLVPLAFSACTNCNDAPDGCMVVCYPTMLANPLLYLMCVGTCLREVCSVCDCPWAGEPQDSKYTPAFEYYQAAIEFCEEYPEECQEYFDAWVESLDEEAEE